MITLEDGVEHIEELAGASLWVYAYTFNGNTTLVRFTCPKGSEPQTGDMIVHNRLVKAKDGKD